MVAQVLTLIGGLQLLAAPIAGLVVGQEESVTTGLLVFASGLISGLILVGFGRVIQHTYESAQRLRDILLILSKDSDDKRIV